MWLRANVVLAVAVVFAVVQMFASVTGGPRIGDSGTVSGPPESGLSRSVAAQEDDDDDDDDDNDEDDDDDNADDDDDDDDNDEDDGDNDDEDDDNEDDGDNDDDADNTDDSDNDEEDDGDNEGEDDADDDEDAPAATSAPTGPAAGSSAVPTSKPGGPAPVTEVQVVTTGAEMVLALPDQSVSVYVFASTPPSVSLTLRLVDPLLYPAVPGVRAGRFIFQVQAFDAVGTELSTLPAEVGLNVWYADRDIVGLDEASIRISRLDPLDQQWKPSPNPWTDPAGNIVWATTTEAGIFAVHVP